MSKRVNQKQKLTQLRRTCTELQVVVGLGLVNSGVGGMTGSISTK